MRTCSECGEEVPEGFNFCGNCGAAVAPAVAAREMRKVVTIVFCDLTGSTALGDRTDPEALRATMRGYYEQMRVILERHGGTVEKFVGDAVMAVFGVPLAHEDDALRAVRAAWQMRVAVGDLGLQARIGVNTGEVVAGEGETLVTGDAVNVAARLEQAAEPGEVLIGSATRDLVRDAVKVERVEVAAKGKPSSVQAYRLVDVDVDPSVSGVARRLDAPLVGRERELALLRQAYDRAVGESSSQLFTMLGTAGVGKTRLSAEFLEGVDATVVRGHCLGYGDGITLWPLIGVLKQLGADDTIERITGTLPAHELFWTVRSRLEQAAAERPLVVVFDDIHWGEPTFLDLVDHVSDLSRGVPLMLLCLARPELLDERPGWAGGKLNATTTLLEPLSSDESAHLLDFLGDDLGDSVRRRVLAAAGGNPLFVEEMVALAREDGDVRATSTVQALLQARLDRLPRAQRSVIERAAVEGEIFHRRSVTELSGEAVDAELVGLVRKELIRPDRGTLPDEEAYRFRHLLIRDAAYEGLPKETRAELHERFARWLENRGGLVELDEIVGHHLEQAALYRRELGRRDEALERAASVRLTSAGDAAVRREDVVAAEKLLVRALALSPIGDPARVPALKMLASVLVGAGAPERVEPLIGELESSDDEGVSTHGRILRAQLAFTHNPQERADVILRTAAVAREVFTRLDDAEGLVGAWTLVAQLHWLNCRAEQTLAATDEAAKHRVHTANRWQVMIMGPLAHGPFEPKEVRRRLAALREANDSRFVAAAARMVESTLLRYEGRLDESLDAWAEGDAIFAELGLELFRRLRGQSRAEVALARGDLEEAERLYRAVYDGLADLSEEGFRSTVAIGLAGVLYRLGRLDEAERLAREGEEMGGPDDLMNLAIGPALRAKIRADRGDLLAAEELARMALAAAERGDLPEMRTATWSALAHVLRAQGRVGEARDALLHELAEHEKHGDTLGASEVRRLLELL